VHQGAEAAARDLIEAGLN